jgi:ribosomal RNA-processing protein 12
LANINAFRDDKAYNALFPFKNELDQAMGSCISSIGMQNFLAQISPNIESENPNEPTRPHVLTWIAEALRREPVTSPWKSSDLQILGVHKLGCFVKDLVPLSDRLLIKASNFKNEEKLLESKLYETLGMQIWDLFPLVCANRPKDLANVFGKLCPILGKILQNNELYQGLQLDLQMNVCTGLANLVTEFRLISQIEPTTESQEKVTNSAKEGLRAIEKFSSRFINALCNCYTTSDMNSDQFQYIERALKALLEIAKPAEIIGYISTTTQEISMFVEKNSKGKRRIYPIIDLTLLLVSFIVKEEENENLRTLFSSLMKLVVHDDVTIVKKAYKGLLELFDKSNWDFEALSKYLLEPLTIQKACQGSTKYRLGLFSKILNTYCGDDHDIVMEFVPQILAEVILATKDGNEKTRTIGYHVLLEMARKIKQVKPEDGLEHVIMMIVAGLGGETSAMQSGAISSLARVLFEYKTEIPQNLLKELIETVLYAFSSTNNDVIKSCFGFIKVCACCLDAPSLDPFVGDLMGIILKHSKHSKFKAKGRHLIERLIRKFSFELIDAFVPEADKKLMNNIKKRRERQKRKKAKQTDQQAEGYEKAIASDSELGSENDDEEQSEMSVDDEKYIPEHFQKQKNLKTKLQIRDDEVIDFLDEGLMSKITIGAQKKQKSLPVNERDGKLVFGEDEDPEAEHAVEPDYYKERMQSELAFTRKADGRIKFEKRKHADDADGEKPVGKRWKQQSTNQKKTGKSQGEIAKMLGRQYKAPKAQGDITRPGMPDPYAYIPLKANIVGNK